MSATVLAAIAACCFAGSHVVSKRGVDTTSVVAGLLISLAAGWLLLLAATLVDLPPAPSAGAVMVFAASGLLAPAVGRAAALSGVLRLGPSRSVPVQTSVYPLFAVAGAMVILGEDLTVSRIAGTFAIVAGILLLARRPRAADQLAEPGTDGETVRRVRRSPKVSAAVLFPVLAGIAYGASDLVRKEGVVGFPHPAFGAFVAFSAALLAWSVAVAVVPSMRRRVSVGPSAPWFVASGVLASTAVLVQFHALELADVSLVSPIVAAQPLVVFALSAALLRGFERITLPVIAGGLAAVAGVILVSR